ncbi:MAG: zinc dependent phospholipase C family protein [Eubacterium sp.]|nr:zinc dependent phospholipase C family protein [Eubacterium sp.]
MPSLYAHNKFGKLVIPKLPEKIKKTIKKYPDSFRIGLQGPDFLFFHILNSNMTKLGISMHHNDTYAFIQHACTVTKKYGIDSPQYSYILGFICHFTLDNACHPYVNQFMKETGCGHVEIEGDLEYLILKNDGYTPESYPIHKLVPNSKQTAVSMAPFFPQLKVSDIYYSLCMMQHIKRFFVAPRTLKRTAITLAMKSTFHYKRLKGHVIMPYPNEKCKTQSKFLLSKLTNSVDEAVFLITNFTNSTLNDTILTGKFHKDFNGNYCIF